MIMKDKTIAIVFLLAATLVLVGQISITIAQHQAEAFSPTLLPSIAQKIVRDISKPPSSGSGCVSGGSSLSCNSLSLQNQENSGNNAAAHQ
jgi:hypothetical protein